MAKKKTHEKSPSRKPGKGRRFDTKLPKTSALAEIEFPSETAVQPAWIAKRYPDYVHDHGIHGELTSVRRSEYAGHTIQVTTSYKIEIDGTKVNLHASVDNDGTVHCHTTPYDRYHSILDLVRTLIDRFPQALTDLQHGSHGHPM
ncbi:MAG: hypothetical protein MI923_01605 [Phycisphaerales bacterium]|nr:hypothetical protein [Phycisphaerales bacterium]